jgi:hypothetical protein
MGSPLDRLEQAQLGLINLDVPSIVLHYCRFSSRLRAAAGDDTLLAHVHDG